MTKFEPTKEIHVTEIKTFEQFLQNGLSLANCTLHGLDFSKLNVNWNLLKIENTTFLGCNIDAQAEELLFSKGAHLYKAPKNLPYRPFRSALYTWQELMEGYVETDDNSIDYRIYRHFSANKFNPNINEALWQRIHDHAMDEALRDLLCFDKNGMTQKRCIGFMGGHSTRRDDPFFAKTAITAKLLTEHDYFVVSGGGPGIMEATNLGAHFAGQAMENLEFAIKTLSEAPEYKSKGYHQKALAVLDKYPDGVESLAIPTWFYGHEPSNLFASHIAKYFSNSIREDTLLAVSLFGIVCAPGSAGTTQEIFMDATQNHYGTFNYYSPMVFLGKKRYAVDTMIFPLLQQLAWGRPYSDLLHLTDEPEEVLQFLKEHPPMPINE